MLEAAGLDGASMVVITVDDADAARDDVSARIVSALSEAQFEACDEPTTITIPFTFD